MPNNHISRTATIVIMDSPDKILPLFTAYGETLSYNDRNLVTVNDDISDDDGMEPPVDGGGAPEQPMNADGDGDRGGGLMIMGEGIKINTVISPKSLMLYEITNTDMGGGLHLGDFIDVCIEDFFIARHRDIGRITIGGGSDNGR